MAVTEVTELTSTGTHSANGRSYESRYQVMTDDKDDGPTTVLNHFQANAGVLPWRGLTYAYGGTPPNDTDTTSFCNDLRCERDEELRTKWTVTVTFAPLDPNDNEEHDENGDPTDNPLDFRPVLSVGRSFVEKPAQNARYKSGMAEGGGTDSGTKLLAGGLRPVCNSALMPVYPPPMVQKDVQTWTIKFNTNAQIGVEDNRVGVVVDHAWKIDVSKIIVKGIGHPLQEDGVYEADALEAKCTDIRIVPMFRNGYAFWECHYTFSIDRDTWRYKDVDAGWHQRFDRATDKDKYGGTKGATSVIAGRLEVKEIVDSDGNRTSTMPMLNGNGEPIAPAAATPDAAVVHEWSLEEHQELPIDSPYQALFATGIIIKL